MPAFCVVSRKFTRVKPGQQNLSFVDQVGDSYMISRVQLNENTNEDNMLQVDEACSLQRYKDT